MIDILNPSNTQNIAIRRVLIKTNVSNCASDIGADFNTNTLKNIEKKVKTPKTKQI